MNTQRAHRRKAVIFHTDDVTISFPLKREKMDVSNTVNQGSFIKIQQSVRHDVWNIQKKNDGTYTVKKVNEDGPAAGEHAENSGSVTNATNTAKLGARPKTTVQQKFSNINTVNTPKNSVEVPTVTLNPANVPKSVITVNRTAPANDSATVKATTTPKGGGIFVTPISAPRKEVITINTTAAPKKEFVITINTTKAPKNEVITINTTRAPTEQPVTVKTEPVVTTNQADAQDQETSNMARANASFIELEQQLKHSFQNIGKEEKNDQQNESNLTNEFDRATLSGSPVTYSDEACRIQEMFPGIPLDVIANNLMVSGSVQTTINNILDGKVLPPPKPPRRPAVVLSENKAFAQPSLKTEGNELKTKQKGGSIVKIELLASNEVWNIKKKENEGFVMKKIEPENEANEAPCQSSTSLNEAPYVDSWTGDMEDCNILSAEDMFIGDTPYKANPEQVSGPVKLMVYAQSSGNQSPVSKRRSVAAVPDDENDKSPMEVDADDHLCLEKNVCVVSFVFSDDENEDDETVERFLFKGSLHLKKLKYINETNETKNRNPEKSELLNITGGSESEKGSVAEGVTSGKGSDSGVAEQGIKSEEGSNAGVVQQGTISEKRSCTVMNEDCSDEYYSDYDDE